MLLYNSISFKSLFLFETPEHTEKFNTLLLTNSYHIDYPWPWFLEICPKWTFVNLYLTLIKWNIESIEIHSQTSITGHAERFWCLGKNSTKAYNLPVVRGGYWIAQMSQNIGLQLTTPTCRTLWKFFLLKSCLIDMAEDYKGLQHLSMYTLRGIEPLLS